MLNGTPGLPLPEKLVKPKDNSKLSHALKNLDLPKVNPIKIGVNN